LPGLRIGELPGAEQQVLQRVVADARQPDKHARVVEVVILQVVHIRFFGDERVSIGEVDADDEGAWLSRLVRGGARQQAAAQLEGGCAVRGAPLHVRQRKRHFPHRAERHSLTLAACHRRTS
jgi:hypothetical protein